MTPDSTLLPDWLGRCAENYPRRLALQCGPLRWSFAELDRHASRAARQLAGAGVQAGQRVALLAANNQQYVMLVHALTRLGAVLVPLNVRLTLQELCWQVSDVYPALLVNDALHDDIAREIGGAFPALPRMTLASEAHAGAMLLDALPEAEAPLRNLIDLHATQAILYTSGTTGKPKAALITYAMQWWSAVGSSLNLGLRADDCWLACLPFFHIGGLSILMRSVIYGMSVVAQEKFDASEVNRSIGEDGVTIISVVAVMLQRMLAAQDASGDSYPQSLRCVLLGGGPAPASLLEDCARRHIPVVQTYGLTESCSQAVTLTPGDALRKLGSAGRPLLPVRLRILREGQIAQANEVGEIQLQGPTITPGYVGRPDATKQAFADGWFATGDLGYLDDEGYLFVLDRRSDLIISGGENIYPAEIETVLLAHPSVQEAGVCGQDDARWGQVAVAFVHVKDGSIVTSEELLAFAAQRLARYKLPRAIYFTAPLPRNSSGKLLRRDLPRLRQLENHTEDFEDAYEGDNS